MKRFELLGVLLVFAGGGLVGHGIAGFQGDRPQLSTANAVTVSKALATVPGLTATSQPSEVDSATQGDDTIVVARVEAKDGDGPLTIFVTLDNGAIVGAAYAQNGSAAK